MTKVNWTIQLFLFIVLVLCFSSLLYFDTSQKQLQCLLRRAANIGNQFQDTVVQELKFCWPSTSLLTSRNCKELNNTVLNKVINRVFYINYFKICEKYWKFCNYFVVNSPVTYRTFGNVTYGTKFFWIPFKLNFDVFTSVFKGILINHLYLSQKYPFEIGC